MWVLMVVLPTKVETVGVSPRIKVAATISSISYLVGLGMMGTGSYMIYSSGEESRKGEIGALLLLGGASVIGLGTSFSQILAGATWKGLTSLACKLGLCLLFEVTLFNEDLAPYRYPAYLGGGVGCLGLSTYDLANVVYASGKRFIRETYVEYDTLYDTLRVTDTVVVEKRVVEVKYVYIKDRRGRIIRGDRKKAELEYRLGLQSYALGDFHKALDHFRKAVQYDPTYKKAQEALRRVGNMLR
ncbi:MAG: tetratricopeptide repeat protein [Thermotogae bacterium]|nr:tetratricopeptide repeat protein [Thermotogota bacterium]